MRVHLKDLLDAGLITPEIEQALPRDLRVASGSGSTHVLTRSTGILKLI